MGTVDERRVALNPRCIEWRGWRTPRNYGVTGAGIRASRWVYELFYGPIPNGLIVRHKCDNPPCINPLHLLVGTHKDNAADRDSRGRNGKTKKTHCPAGHAYAGSNLYLNRKGDRICRRCHANQENRRYREGRKLARLD